jgi:hypothetical protein
MLLLFIAASASFAQVQTPADTKSAGELQAGRTAILPPAIPWQGRSESLVAAKGDPWITPAEASDFMITPRYLETFEWLERLAKASPLLEMISIGRTPEGRDIKMVIASADKAFTPAALKSSGKPALFVQAGIHAGEIDGKDAALMLLRDLTVTGSKRPLLDRANLLFVPILNPDGHERFGPFGRINQRGPASVGWRTNARNLNLNRDFAKLDSPELTALVRAFNEWSPHLVLDIHVTDGVDYQYDITWGYNSTNARSPAQALWMDTYLTTALARDLKNMGHIPGPLVFAVDDQDITKGITFGNAAPRFSHGYGDARHLPTVLVENHSLKPNAQRVLGTYVLIESALDALGRHGASLRRAIEQDRNRQAATVPLTWKAAADSPARIAFAGVSFKHDISPITGTAQISWTGQPVPMEIPLHLNTQPDLVVRKPKAYLIPAAWTTVIERLAIHGVEMERLDTEKTISVEMYRLEEPQYSREPFEGRFRVSARKRVEQRHQRFPVGSVRVPADQPLGTLAVLLLEPDSPDSFLQWGFFNEVLQRTEYVEAYVMEPMARRMLEQDPSVREAFEQRLGDDATFAADPTARLHWFYRKTPFFDEQWRLYPVAREVENSDN